MTAPSPQPATAYEPMTREEIRDYAEALMIEFGRRVEGWDIVLQVEPLAGRKVIDEIDQARVHQLIGTAAISVHWD